MQINQAPKTISNPHSPTHLIIVMGVSGSGKSTLAKTLGQAYGYQYLDADDFHSDEARALMAKGIALTDEQRAPWVDNLRQQLQLHARTQSHTVLAFSGLKHKHRDILRSAGLRTIFLFLRGDKTNIQARLQQRQHHFMSPQLLDSQFDSLEDPTNESDVYPLAGNNGPKAVFNEAKAIADNLFGIH